MSITRYRVTRTCDQGLPGQIDGLVPNEEGAFKHSTIQLIDISLVKEPIPGTGIISIEEGEAKIKK